MSAAHHHAHGEMGFAVALTLGYAAVEAGVGMRAGSLALLADAGHMVNDAGADVRPWDGKAGKNVRVSS